MEPKLNSILIVDDEPLNIKALTMILSSGYNIFAATNGRTCLEIAKKIVPDLILLDIIMPEMDGFEVIKALKADEDTREVPIIFVTGLTNSDDEVKGFSLGASDYIPKPFSAPVVKMRVQHQIKIVNLIREIRQLSVTDALTGVGNRRFFNILLSQEWERAKREQTPLGFMILDIDHFKQFNDAYGHLCGDKALVNVAKVIQTELTRATDKVARWGGEEFAIILPGTDLRGSRKVSEQIRLALEANVFETDDNAPVSITVSIGLHNIIPERTEIYTLSNFIGDADKALYHAKRNGRNRVCVVGET